MSLSELFKPWLGSCSACATPRPNVALVLQYLQALRVSLTLSQNKIKRKNLIYSAPGSFFLQKVLFFVFLYFFCVQSSSYGHTTVKAPHPIRTAKLSTVGPDQYYGRGLRGNLRCCMAFCFFAFIFIFCTRKKNKKSGEGDLNSRPKDSCACALYSPLLYR